MDTDISYFYITVNDEPPLGAHLTTMRRGYYHHGIYVGSGQVIHYSGLGTSYYRGPIEEVSLERFSAGSSVWICSGALPKFSSQEVVSRARSRLGEDKYKILTNNCEHFCTWCIYGESHSTQVEVLLLKPLSFLFNAALFLTNLAKMF